MARRAAWSTNRLHCAEELGVHAAVCKKSQFNNYLYTAARVRARAQTSTKSMSIATPAMTHRAGGDLVFSCAENTYVGPRCSVLYTGHE